LNRSCSISFRTVFTREGCLDGRTFVAKVCLIKTVNGIIGVSFGLKCHKTKSQLVVSSSKKFNFTYSSITFTQITEVVLRGDARGKVKDSNSFLFSRRGLCGRGCGSWLSRSIASCYWSYGGSCRRCCLLLNL
jgi:hypothetical protein